VALGEVVVDGDDPVGVVAERDQVPLELAHVGAVVDADRQLPPGRQPAVEELDRPAVHPVQGLAAADDGPLLRQPGDGALALVGHGADVAVAERALDLLLGAKSRHPRRRG